MLISISEGGAEGLPFPPRQLAELLLAIEAGVALEQLANPDALGGPGVSVLGRLSNWFGPVPVTTMAETISLAERAAVGEAFGVPVIDMFVSTEGQAGNS